MTGGVTPLRGDALKTTVAEALTDANVADVGTRDRSKDILDDLQRALDPLSCITMIAGVLDDARLSAARLTEPFRELGELLARQFTVIQQFMLLLPALGWPPTGRVEAGTAKAILDLLPKDTIPEPNAGIDQLIVAAYPEAAIDEIEASWEQQPHLRKRMPILRAALRAHKNGEYWISIPALVTQVEGTRAECFKHVGRLTGEQLQDYYKRIRTLDGSSLSSVADAFFCDILLAQFSHGSPMPALSRHAILHGADTSYGTEVNSLKVILWYDYLVQQFGFAVVAGSCCYHRIGCGTVWGKAGKRIAPMPDLLEPKGLRPCRICKPDEIGHLF